MRLFAHCFCPMRIAITRMTVLYNPETRSAIRDGVIVPVKGSTAVKLSYPARINISIGSRT